MPEWRPKEAGAWRDPALDLARGVAVLTMIWVHFVPEPAATGGGLGSRLQQLSLMVLDGFPAVLFLLLVGASAAAAGPSPARRVWRRSGCLAAIGLVFWSFVWPNDILLPIAMMMLLVAGLQRMAPRTLVAVVVGMLVTVPVATWLWGDYAWRDVLEDGTHVANHEWGWGTLRYFLIDGAYPLLPWSVFPVLGLLLARVRHDARALRSAAVVASLAALVALLVSHFWGDEYARGFAAHLDVTWQPTSVPFVAMWGGVALAFLAVLMIRLPRGPMLASTGRVAAVGRASLSHYLVHILVVYGALRIWWPDEDWSTAVGLAAACSYMAFALLATPWLLRGGRRAPVEALLARCSGR